MNEFEQRWKRIAEALQHEMNGDVRPRVSSGRTLFGIRSEAEEKMDRFAREIEEEQKAKRTEQRDHANNEPRADDGPCTDKPLSR